MYLHGGFDGAELGQLYSYNPAANTWQLLETAGVQRGAGDGDVMLM